jgi:intracellular sulfur oxidation DsrE/DsrF family protein
MKLPIARFALVAVIGAGTLALAQSEARVVDTKVLYEIPTRSSARVVLRAVDKHLDDAHGHARIAVVAHGGGAETMLAGAKDDAGVAYAPAIDRLRSRGVDFAVCGATLAMRHIDPKRVLPQLRIVDGGNAEIARLGAEGYVRLN